MEVEIHSISDYFKILEELGTDNYIFRGQNNPYNGIIASGFRNYSKKDNVLKMFDLKKISEDFSNKIIRNLSLEEKNHIFAFSQHHGIPTNLVDFTFSPLVALFFSCYNKNFITFTVEELIEKNSFDSIELLKINEEIRNQFINNLVKKISSKTLTEYSEIYLIDKSKLIDISQFVIKEKETNLLILLNNLDFLIFFTKKIEDKFEDTRILNKLLINLLENYRNNNFNFFRNKMHSFEEEEEDILEKYKILISESKGIGSDGHIEDLFKYIRKNFPVKWIIESKLIADEYQNRYSTSFTAAKCYTLLLINLLKMMEYDPEECYLSLELYCTYQPPEIFDRIINQKGIFISQSYLIDELGYSDRFMKQSIKPDIVIKVNNSQQILKELKFLGIDNGFIFNDIDNIAKSIVKEHIDRVDK